MTEKSSGVEPVAKLLFGRQREGGVLTHPWNISVFPQQKSVWAIQMTRITSGGGMAVAQAFSYYYNEVFTVCNSPTSLHTAITQV